MYDAKTSPPSTRLIVPFERENFLAYYGDYSHLPDADRHLIDLALTYFENCKIKTLPITTAGLAMAVKMTRDELFSKSKDDTITGYNLRKALTICEKFAEQQLYTGSSAGAQFALKNLGWKDKQETELRGDFNLTMLLKAIKIEDK